VRFAIVFEIIRPTTWPPFTTVSCTATNLVEWSQIAEPPPQSAQEWLPFGTSGSLVFSIGNSPQFGYHKDDHDDGTGDEAKDEAL
jgi:hypothetical protein